MTLFHEDGHLTDEGLRAVLDGSLSELQSLEASEHIGFCPLCLECYLTLLEGTELMVPETSVKESVLKKVGRKTKQIIFSRYATVAVAACLVLAMWGSGFLTGVMNASREGSSQSMALEENAAAQPAKPKEPGESLAIRMNRAASELPGVMNDLFGFLSPSQRGGAEAQEDTPAEEGGEEDNATSEAAE